MGIFFLVCGSGPSCPVVGWLVGCGGVQQMARENLMKSKLKSKEYYDRWINPQNFKIGDLEVYLLKKPTKGKFSDQYTGPHKVLKILQIQDVKIEVKGIPRTVHLSKLKLADHRDRPPEWFQGAT